MELGPRGRGTKSRAITISLSPQCRSYNRPLSIEKLLSPLFPVCGGAALQMAGAQDLKQIEIYSWNIYENLILLLVLTAIQFGMQLKSKGTSQLCQTFWKADNDPLIYIYPLESWSRPLININPLKIKPFDKYQQFWNLIMTLS